MRVLVAGGDPGLCRQLRKRLADAEVEVDFVQDARAAFQGLREHVYSVLLIDVSMPQLCGERVLEFVHAMNRVRRPVVLVLADAMSARSLDVEVVQIVLRKPCQPGYLAELVQCCVQTSTRHRDKAASDSEQAIA